MVYNGMSSSLNEVIWAPQFTLPTMSTKRREIELGTNMGDIDIGKMFLNFMMQKIIRKCFGVDVMYIRPKEPKLLDWESKICSEWEFWCIDMMIIIPSP